MQSSTATSPPGMDLRAFNRIGSIDLIRGLVMIIMALDHVRDYFHSGAILYEPTDLSQTNIFLFFTRWITHFCAPTFMFLSGTSAFLAGSRKGKKGLSRFLWTRGCWLILLEFTVVNFGWYFNFPPPSMDFLVIWALGVSMIALAALVYLPLPVIAGIGLLMVFGHNLLDSVHVHGSGTPAFLWSLLHEPNFYQRGGMTFFIGYPVIPWIGVMALGYCLGELYVRDSHRRRKWLVWMGTTAIVLFIMIRFSNLYGDAMPWSRQSTPAFTLLSFLNVSKYPPSLLYLLITLGPVLLLLAVSEKIAGLFSEMIRVIGRVPMFYYLCHLYLLHLVAVVATFFCGHQPSDMILTGWIAFQPQLKGYGFSLGITYGIWAMLILILYFPCCWYDRYKKNHRQWWLSYL